MYEIRDDQVDVETIMAGIRENLKRRGADGGQSHDEDAMDDFPREPVPLSSGMVGHHLNLLRLLQDPQPQGPIASHGSGMIEWAKRLIRSALAPYHRGLLARQAEFNANVAGLMAELLERLEKSGTEQDELVDEARTRITTLQAQQAAHGHQTAAQATQIAEQTQALADLTTRLDTLQADQAAHAQQTAEQAQARADLTTRLDALQSEYDRIAVQFESRIAEVVNRLASQCRISEDLAAKHLDLGRRFEEQRQELILQKRRLELILSELRKKVGGKREALSKVVAQKEHLMDHSYFLFEDRHRGSLEEIKKRQAIYLPVFKERKVSSRSTGKTVPRVVLDIGCGRGEFLELLREHGVPAKGIDLNEDMVFFCRERGLDVEQTNALAYLESQQDDLLAGVIACQMIEHLQVDDMIEFIKLCYQKLEKGGKAVFETVNPLSLLVSATSFYLDLSHVRQVHPVALQFLAEAIGFIKTEIKFLSPYPDELKLQVLSNSDPDVQKLNHNFGRLNEILFGYQDYALICEK